MKQFVMKYLHKLVVFDFLSTVLLWHSLTAPFMRCYNICHKYSDSYAWANSVDSNYTQLNVRSDQGLYCL